MKKKGRNYWKITLISLFIFLLIVFLWSHLTKETNSRGQRLDVEHESKISLLENIIQDYHKTHTYSKIDLFVCTDTSIDVWNLIKTEGINAQICVGNINKNLSQSDFFKEMNHAWVLAETKPFTWLALETTGGFLVWGDENDLYYNGYCFDNPLEFKKFISLRDDYFETCEEANILIIEWNENYLGKIKTFETSEVKGKIEAKIKECEEITNRLLGLLS